MKKFFLLFVFFLSACALNQSENGDLSEGYLTLGDKIQNQIVEYEEQAVLKLPDSLKDISEKDVFFAQGEIANREQNQKGAGFIKSYETEDHSTLLTVFVYNNLEYGFSYEISPNLEELMSKHLSEIQMYQSTGIGENVKLGKVEKTEIKWKKKVYKLLETSAVYEKDGDDKKTYVMLASVPELFSYVRLRFTYDNNKKSRSFVESKRRVLMARILTMLSEFDK